MENLERIDVEIRKKNRPKYKGQYLTWKRRFIGVAILCAVLTYLLGMVLKGNSALQKNQTIENDVEIIIPTSSKK